MPTSPGLGESGLRPRHVATPPAPPATPSTAAPISETPSSEALPSSTGHSWTAPLERAAKVSTRQARTRSSRPPIRIDNVGDAAVEIASKRLPIGVLKVLKTRSELTDAPIDHRDAFVLSLIDGKMTFQVLVDIAGMPEPEITRILERLARLGIVSLT